MKVFRRMASTLPIQIGSQANGIHSQDQRTKQDIVVKAALEPFFRNERDILKRFQTTSSLRRLIDEVQDPPLLVLEHLDSNLLIESAAKRLESSEVKHTTKAVLQALAALHEEGIVHTDVKPDNILVNYGGCGNRFSDIKLADCGDNDDRLDTLTVITESIEKRTPFKMASSQEIAKEDREFISKLMQLDPRDRPSAKVLLQDAWLTESIADSK
ncbi:MAG: hypothetical protein Q9217_001331 [Psora testacea]